MVAIMVTGITALLTTVWSQSVTSSGPEPEVFTSPGVVILPHLEWVMGYIGSSMLMPAGPTTFSTCWSSFGSLLPVANTMTRQPSVNKSFLILTVSNKVKRKREDF